MRASTSATLTPEANVKASTGMAVSRFKASFINLINILLLSIPSTPRDGVLLNLRSAQLGRWDAIHHGNQSAKGFAAPFGPLFVDFNHSLQWVTKNFLSVGRSVSAFPTIGRRAVVICIATSTKMMIQVFKPAVERALEWEKPFSRKRRPKKVAMSQNTRCSAPIQVTDLVD